MQDQPSAAELVGAVEAFMRDVAMKQLQGHAAFHARVAANALGIVKRELELGPTQNAAEHDRLRALLNADGDLDTLNRQLCQEIREGQRGLDDQPLIDHLWKTTLEKLAVDQPRYSGYKKAVEERSQESE